MLQTFAITGPIYVVIALGFAAGHLVFSKPDMRVLGTYVVRFALPALVFTALSQRPVGEAHPERFVERTRHLRQDRLHLRLRDGMKGGRALDRPRRSRHRARAQGHLARRAQEDEANASDRNG